MLRTFSLRGLFALPVLVVLVALGVTCATGPRPPEAKYPPRHPGCGLHLVYADLPDVPGGWDDIGKLEITCHIDDSERTCFNKMRNEACRMGGNIVYRLPRRVWRPSEYSIGYRAMVAHSRVSTGAATTGSPAGEELPPPATEEEAAGPVVPLTGPGAPGAAVAAPASADAGGTD
jgi:hypothetical protein